MVLYNFLVKFSFLFAPKPNWEQFTVCPKNCGLINLIISAPKRQVGVRNGNIFMDRILKSNLKKKIVMLLYALIEHYQA